MPLNAYQKKRSFKKSSEPKGVLGKKSQHNFLHFVIQKHAASHLHYDFRLEMHGVLKSWAIPKGPSLNPNVKRLAIQVEDHPYEYKDFEGIIPEGNYGAGKVIIWDEGSYDPGDKSIKDFDKYFVKSLKLGHIDFVLHGQKLSGKFSLVKIKSPQKNAWLLIKTKENKSRQKDTVSENSVRSGLAVEQLQHEPRNQAALSKMAAIGPKVPMPKFVAPMLATLVNKPFDHPDWLFEIKWDGYRILAFVDHKRVKLYSRNRQDYTKFFSTITSTLAKLDIKAVFDGEMVVVDDRGISSFELMQKYQSEGKGQLIYYIFDLVWFDGHDLHELPLIQRKQLLAHVIPSLEQIQVSEYIEQAGKKFYKLAKAHHVEGIMAKEGDSIYQEDKRTHSWLKIKSRLQQEAVICGYTAPRGSRKLLGALILGIYEKGHLKYIGHTGTGFSEKFIEELKPRLDKLAQTQAPFAQIPKTNSPVTWLKPQLVCEVAFHEWTQQGYMRQPAFLGMREDKLARSVHKESSSHIETLMHKKSAAKKLSNNVSQDEKILTLDRHRLKITNLNKVFWAESGYTKKDLIEYYYTIAPFILPYLKAYPQVLHRFPDGISGEQFYQKNIEYKASGLKTHAIYSESENKKINYLICQNKYSLLYMANLGCIEMNPWLSKYTNLENPEFCVLDLDPEGIEFEAVIEVASFLHKFLEQLEVVHYCKTSGATGMHIYLPLRHKYTFEQSRQFAELICSYVNHELPQITSMERMPTHRKGKVYLDCLQNRFGQTVASPYSVRPYPGAPVSTPLHWDELKNELTPMQFTIENTQQRLKQEGDIWQSILKTGINIEKILKKLG
jgi:bifunctional non-homologous end joining protein LigD